MLWKRILLSNRNEKWINEIDRQRRRRRRRWNKAMNDENEKENVVWRNVMYELMITYELQMQIQPREEEKNGISWTWKYVLGMRLCMCVTHQTLLLIHFLL